MSIPEEFIPEAVEIGYGVCSSDVHRLDEEWDAQAARTIAWGAGEGFRILLDGRRVWAYKGEDTYLLAAATAPGDDPLNLWAQAFQRLDFILTQRGSPTGL